MKQLTLRVLKLKVVRYFFSAATATIVDVGVYYYAFNFIYDKENVDVFGLIVLSAPTTSLMLSYTCGLITNFIIAKTGDRFLNQIL